MKAHKNFRLFQKFKIPLSNIFSYFSYGCKHSEFHEFLNSTFRHEKLITLSTKLLDFQSLKITNFALKKFFGHPAVQHVFLTFHTLEEHRQTH